MDYISYRLSEPNNRKEIIPWNKLSTKGQNTLRRAIERSVTWEKEFFQGFTYELMTQISIRDLHDARFIGPTRAEELIQELIAIFDRQEINKELASAVILSKQIVSISSLHILAKLTVEDELDKYLERIGSVDLLTPQQRHTLLQELSPSKNPFKRIMFGNRDQETALAHLIDANLRLSFALAKRVCADRDLRARTVAGNLGLLAGITSFSDEPNVDFESYVMSHVRKFIQDLIGSFNLSYDDIVELMLDAKEREIESIEAEEDSESEIPFASCATFSELFEQLDYVLLKLPKVDDRAISMLKHRHQAFGEPGLTLDDIGKMWGVTRERVRQIVDPLMKVTIQLESEVPLLLKAVEIFEDCENEDQFRTKVATEEIFSGEDIPWQRLWGLTRILSPEVLADRVYEKHLEMESESGTSSTIRSLIKKDRSKFGLYDLQIVSKKYEVNQDKAFKIISEIYPRSIRSGSLVLARTENLDTMFENSIAKQLKVSSPLEVKELLKGLQRTGKQRAVSLIGSTADLSGLILDLAGNPPNYVKASSGLIKEVDFQTLEKWLIDIFSETNLGILHSNDVVNFALRDRRINVSSVTVYLLNSPIMRSHGRSLYSLVGTEVTEDQLDAYIQIIRGSSEASEVSFEMTNASKGILSVKPNLNVITSGIVFPPSGYKEIFRGFEFETFCSCGQLETIQAVKFAPSGFWTGFTAMIRHGFSQHHMTKGSTFRFEFDFDKREAHLLID